MTFSIYVPDVARNQPNPPVLYYLSGLTCTDMNAREKSGFVEFAS
jgi:S-formylglutathione hydrolase FrmB